MKKCTKCGEEKELDKFHKRRSGGSHSYCKSCHSEWSRARNLKIYGLTIEEYISMAAQQNNLCAICSKPETVGICGKPALLSVDHDHKTNKVRALLCRNCNRLLGRLEKDAVRLQMMLNYLDKYKGGES